MTPEEFDALVARVEDAVDLVKHGKKLTVEQAAALDDGKRCSKLSLERRNEIMALLAQADREYLLPNMVKPAPTLPVQSADEVLAAVKKLKRGDFVWFEREGAPRRGVVVKVMARTVCIDVDGAKDFQIPKNMVLAVEES
ncbi:MAG: hypothetical protein WC789_09345 [Lentisphaeria bacterium]